MARNDDNQEEDFNVGNFWSNPGDGLAGLLGNRKPTEEPKQQRQPRSRTKQQGNDSRRGFEEDNLPVASQRGGSVPTEVRRKAQMARTFRSGSPPPPRVFEEFVDKLLFSDFKQGKLDRVSAWNPDNVAKAGKFDLDAIVVRDDNNGREQREEEIRNRLRSFSIDELKVLSEELTRSRSVDDEFLASQRAQTVSRPPRSETPAENEEVDFNYQRQPRGTRRQQERVDGYSGESAGRMSVDEKQNQREQVQSNEDAETAGKQWRAPRRDGYNVGSFVRPKDSDWVEEPSKKQRDSASTRSQREDGWSAEASRVQNREVDSRASRPPSPPPVPRPITERDDYQQRVETDSLRESSGYGVGRPDPTASNQPGLERSSRRTERSWDDDETGRFAAVKKNQRNSEDSRYPNEFVDRDSGRVDDDPGRAPQHDIQNEDRYPQSDIGNDVIRRVQELRYQQEIRLREQTYDDSRDGRADRGSTMDADKLYDESSQFSMDFHANGDPDEVYSAAARREDDARSRRNRPLSEQRRPKPNFSGDWASKTVSSWFEEGEADQAENVGGGSYQKDDLQWRQSRRRRTGSILTGVKNAVGEMVDDWDRKAGAYDREMTKYLGNKMYREGRDGLSAEGTTGETGEQRPKPRTADPKMKRLLGTPRTPRKVLSQEQRKLALERIPPVGIKSWGPTGELRMDARTKAILDARAELSEAERVLELMKEKTARAQEEVIVLRTDEELAKKRLKLEDPRLAREQLRELALEIDAASRTLEIARSYEQKAQHHLDRTEDRHWGLLNIPDQPPPNME